MDDITRFVSSAYSLFGRYPLATNYCPPPGPTKDLTVAAPDGQLYSLLLRWDEYHWETSQHLYLTAYRDRFIVDPVAASTRGMVLGNSTITPSLSDYAAFMKQLGHQIEVIENGVPQPRDGAMFAWGGANAKVVVRLSGDHSAQKIEVWSLNGADVPNFLAEAYGYNRVDSRFWEAVWAEELVPIDSELANAASDNNYEITLKGVFPSYLAVAQATRHLTFGLYWQPSAPFPHSLRPTDMIDSNSANGRSDLRENSRALIRTIRETSAF